MFTKSVCSGLFAVTILGIAGALSAGCPPDGEVDAFAQEGIPHGDNGPPFREGNWLFAFYLRDANGLYEAAPALAGLRMNADGTAGEYFYDKSTVPAVGWSALGVVFELIHESDTFVCVGTLKSREYIEGAFEDSANGMEGVFAAHFLAKDLDDEGTAEPPAMKTGHWEFQRFARTMDGNPISIDDYGNQWQVAAGLVLKSNGGVAILNDLGEPVAVDFVWFQKEIVFGLVSEFDNDPAEDTYDGNVLTPRLIAGTIISELDNYFGTFVARFVPTEHDHNPSDEIEPIGAP